MAQAQNANDEIRLRATARSVVLLGDFSGVVIPVHFDPGFALTVRIESASPPVAGFAPGSVVTFAIHSPTLLFAGEPAKGKTYAFVLHRKIENGKVRFFGLYLQDMSRRKKLDAELSGGRRKPAQLPT
jgi:hypothetical protein